MPIASNFYLPSPPYPIKIKENFLSEQVDRYRLKTTTGEINWSNDFYLDMLSLDFASLFSTVDFESLEMKKLF